MKTKNIDINRWFIAVATAGSLLWSAAGFAATNTWNGIIDNLWTTPGNWSGSYASGNTNEFTNVTATDRKSVV